MRLSERYARLLLAQCVNVKLYKLLIEKYNSISDIIISKGKFKSIIEITEKNINKYEEIIRTKSFDVLRSNIEKYKVKFILFEDTNYPEILSRIYDPPKVLYYKGNYSKEFFYKSIAVVGTRNASHYGKNCTNRIVSGLVEAGFIIVSGMAFGIDVIAHGMAVDRGGRTVAVLAGGVESPSPVGNSWIYRKILDSNGFILSENPPEYEIFPAAFPIRSRVISGLCKGLVVIEAGEKSGALIAARQAIEQGREVFAVPGSIFSRVSKGTNELIKKGEAKLVNDVNDILDEFGVQQRLLKEETVKSYSPEEKKIADLISIESMTIDNIVRMSKMGVSEVASILSLMEIEGKVTRDEQEKYYLL